MEPSDRRYTRDHEWIRVQDGEGQVGITDYAQRQLGDVVFVELPEVGRELRQGETMGVVESVKSVADVYAPVSGQVVEVNEALRQHPEKVNASPYGEGWMVVVRLKDPQELEGLMSAQAYEAFLQEEGGQ
jgi:glycine cleavage system H protein